MARTRELRKRIAAIKTIQRITRTMQMIATSRFTAAQQRVLAARPYGERMVQLVGEVLAAAAASGGFEHKLLAAPSPPAKRERLLVITSNRGLCGAYNTNVLRASMAHARELASRGVEFEVEIAGKKAAAYFKFQKVPVANAYKFSDKIQYEETERLADKYMADFLEGKLDAVRVAYMYFASSSRQAPQVMQILPLAMPAAGATAKAAEAGPQALYDFAPSAQVILEELIPLYVKTMIFQAALNAAVSEQIMRMVAMKAATENARDLSRTFTRRYNRARQSQITTELMEVIGGAAALE
jgi:F-type H+-transporting ATPase subunit gamma